MDSLVFLGAGHRVRTERWRGGLNLGKTSENSRGRRVWWENGILWNGRRWERRGRARYSRDGTLYTVPYCSKENGCQKTFLTQSCSLCNADRFILEDAGERLKLLTSSLVPEVFLNRGITSLDVFLDGCDDYIMASLKTLSCVFVLYVQYQVCPIKAVQWIQCIRCTKDTMLGKFV